MTETLTLPAVYNAAVDFIDGNPAPDAKTAIIDDRGLYTYGELKERVDRAGRALLDIGLTQESRVAMAMLDSVDFPSVFWGSIKAGIVPVCLNTLLTTDSYEFILRDCRARVLIVDELLYEKFEPILDRLPGLEKVVVVGEDGHGHQTLSDLMQAAPAALDAAVTNRDEVAFWLYSSGSTGQPKGVKHLHGSLAQTARFSGESVLGINADDVVFSAAKLFFAYGLGNALTFPTSVGATAILMAERPTPDSVMRTLATHHPTIFYGVPTLYAAILNDPSNTADAGSARLRLCVSAGEPLPESIGLEWENRFGREILDGIGSTEMLHVFISNHPGDVRYGWTGKPVAGYEARIVNDDDSESPIGEIGELLIRGPSAAEGYWNQRAKSLHTFVGEWTRTGDKYLRDEDGYYLYCGRTDDMFKVGGNWVSPFEIESAIMEHDAALEAAVIARPDEAGNLKPKAFVVAAAGVDPDEQLGGDLKEYVRSRLELWKYPRWIEFVPDLPKTATGKIQRFKLRELDRSD